MEDSSHSNVFAGIADETSVKVVARLRPMNDEEKKYGETPAVSANSEQKSITVIKGRGVSRSVFVFDEVFTSFTTQDDLFQTSIAPIVDDVLHGYESTIFAYGQTGTGKTFTMEGDLNNPVNFGVIPRAAKKIFEGITDPCFQGAKILVSYLEIYNEELSDLLVDSTQIQKLEIVNGKSGTYCRGLSEVEVNSSEEVLALMLRADQSRRIGETRMNKQSSRSHCIFTIQICATRKVDSSQVDFKGKLHLVDLAGSECAKNAGFDRSNLAEAARERERTNINRSLLTLGRVISAVKEQSLGKKTTRVPYRDSKLTRMLQEALGGRCKTIIIATLSPSESSLKESISTLNYAHAACGIINRPVITSSSINTGLQDMGINSHNVEHWFEMECKLKYMESQVESAQVALARKNAQYIEAHKKLEYAESAIAEKDAKVSSLTETVRMKEEENKKIEKQLSTIKVSFLKCKAVLDATKKTEIALTNEASNLINALKSSIADGNEIHKLLMESRESHLKRKNATKKFSGVTTAVLDDITSRLQNLAKKESEFSRTLTTSAEERTATDVESLESSVTMIREMLAYVVEVSTQIKYISLQDKNGVIPSLETLKANLLNNNDEIKNIISKTDEEVSESTAGILSLVREYAQQFKNIDNENNTMAEKLIQTFEENVTHSLETLSNIGTTLMQDIEEVSRSTDELRTDMSSLLNNYTEESLRSVNVIESKADEQLQKLGKTMKTFTDDMKHHEILATTLQDQRDDMDKVKIEHLKELSEQEQVLDSQESYFAFALEQQKQIQDDFIHNVSMGFHNIVKEEMQRLMDDQEKHFTQFFAMSKNAKDVHGTILNSSSNIFRRVGDVNSSIMKTSASMLANDQFIHSEVLDTMDFLTEIKKEAQEGVRIINTYNTNFESQLKLLESQDNALRQCIAKNNKNQDDLSNEILNNVLKTTMYGMDDITKSRNKFTEETNKNFVSNAETNLLTLDKIRKGGYTDVNNHLRKYIVTAEEDKKTTESAVQRICLISNDAVSTLDSRQMEYTLNTVDARKKKIEEEKKKMIELANSHLTGATEALSKINYRAREAGQKIDSFKSSVMNVDQEEAPLSERNRIVYSEKLSSTPSTRKIWESLGYAPSDSLSDVSTSSKTNKNCKENKSEPLKVIIANRPAYEAEADESVSSELSEPGESIESRSAPLSPHRAFAPSCE